MVKPKPNKAGGIETRGPPPLPNRDVFHRVNFAYQSAAFLQQLVNTPSIRSDVKQSNKRSSKADQKKKRKVVLEVGGEGITGSAESGTEWGKLARKGTKEMKKMAIHTQIELDPSIKRAICKSCSTVLIPGLTCRIRNRPSKIHTHLTHYTCLNCQTLRSIPNPPLSLPVIPQVAMETEEDMSNYQQQKITKAAFHEREMDITAPKGRDGGHGIWRGDTALTGWGANISNQTRPDDER